MPYETCWIEVYEGGGAGPDFGFPEEAPRFANLGAPPSPAQCWRVALTVWAKLQGKAVYQLEVDGEDGGTISLRLWANELETLLDDILGPANPSVLALKTRIRVENKYLVAAEGYPRRD